MQFESGSNNLKIEEQQESHRHPVFNVKGGRILPRLAQRRSNPSLKATIGTVQLENPTILASGILGVAGGGLVRAWKGGAGAVVAKTVGITAKQGHSGPRIVGVRGGGFLNSMGLPNPGVDNYLIEIKEAQEMGATVIGSVMGSNPEGYASVARHLAETGVAAIELNVSCPHVGSLYLQGMQPELVTSIVNSVTRVLQGQVPIWIKLPGTTDYPRLVEVAKAAERAGAAAVVAINTLPALALDVETHHPFLGGGIGGLSGPAIRPIAVRAVWELYKSNLSIPIVGVGGITSGEDVIEFILAGASAVQIGTSVITRGSMVFKEVCGEVKQYLKRHKIGKLQSLVGQTHKIMNNQ